jgi:hypothetical protein
VTKIVANCVPFFVGVFQKLTLKRTAVVPGQVPVVAAPLLSFFKGTLSLFAGWQFGKDVLTSFLSTLF